jgi:hypothetical protein
MSSPIDGLGFPVRPGFLRPDSPVQFGGDYITGPHVDCTRYLLGAARSRSPEGRRLRLHRVSGPRHDGKHCDKHMIVVGEFSSRTHLCTW